MRTRPVTLLTVLLLAILGLAVRPAPASAQAPRPGGVLRFAVRAEASTLDPH